ncbi:hypothetical protein Scep_007730 [Stephania cephalantha]|uniref:Cell wall hydroxyproline-rich glycoprotein n=1 Tax=Stephania cephalantha TaxID=152367 RepID=A0AAP0PLE1_9MAGN
MMIHPFGNATVVALDDPTIMSFENPRLRQAYIALQAWKSAIFSDPLNFTSNWVGPNVCSYSGVYCAPSPYNYSNSNSNSSLRDRVVAGIDLNHADIAGYLPPELGLLKDQLALIHLNSNRFCGTVPSTFRRLNLLFEIDISNNRFVGGFPNVLLSLPSLKYLDLRFNDFEGSIPSRLFDRPLDAIFLNDNRFRFGIPHNLGNSPVSALVLANNDLRGCIPSSIGNMADTLNEILLINDNLTGCLPPEVGLLKKLTVFDVSFNRLQGSVPSAVCALLGTARLSNFNYSFNYFTGEGPNCRRRGGGGDADGRRNCIPGKPVQRSSRECFSESARPVDCSKFKCGDGSRSRRRRPPTTSHPPPPSSKSSPWTRTRSPPPHSTYRHAPPPPPPPPPLRTPPSPSPHHDHYGHPPPPPPGPRCGSPTPSPSPPLVDNVPLPPVVGVSYASPPPPTIPYA